jgi:hypothetical protein
MTNIPRIFLTVSVIASFLMSCATSMTPMEVNNSLPTLTQTRFVSQLQAEEDMKSNRCKYLVKGRTYTAPVAFSVEGDLKNAAQGIDEWVKLDGGNAYVLKDYKWVTVSADGTTQLYVQFDTLLYAP